MVSIINSIWAIGGPYMRDPITCIYIYVDISLYIYIYTYTLKEDVATLTRNPGLQLNCHPDLGPSLGCSVTPGEKLCSFWALYGTNIPIIIVIILITKRMVIIEMLARILGA